VVVLWERLSSRDYSATGLSRLESRSHKEMEAIEIGFCGCLASLIVKA
jgi:hypothetical protein